MPTFQIDPRPRSSDIAALAPGSELRVVVRIDDRVAGEGGISFLAAPDDDSARVHVLVAPEDRGSGVGRALAERLEEIALERGCARLLASAISEDGGGPRIPAPLGSGSVPLGGAEVRFLLARGYSLERVEAVSPLGYRSSWLKCLAVSRPLDDGSAGHSEPRDELQRG